MTLSRRTVAADRSGFVLVPTLLLLGLVSAGAVAIMIEAKAGASGVADLSAAARARAVAHAGVTRAAYSFIVANDPLKASVRARDSPALWRFDGVNVVVSVTSESDRMDLNAGRFELIEASLDRAELSSELRQALREGIAHARANGAVVPAVGALVAPCLRSSDTIRRLDDVFTVQTRAAGITVSKSGDDNLGMIPGLRAIDGELIDQAVQAGRSLTDDARLLHLRPFLSDRSSYYRLSARVDAASATAGRRAAVSLSAYWPRVRVARSVLTGPILSRPCG